MALSNAFKHALPSIPGYILTKTLHLSSRTAVYRGIAVGDNPPMTTNRSELGTPAQGCSVVIKVLRSPQPSITEQVQFRNQYEITHQLNHPALARPLALERNNSGYALVFPDENLISLTAYWQQTKNQNLSEVLAIALQLTDTLDYLSQKRIIHKDIKPANILIHPKTKKIKLIDFSIASLLPRENVQHVNLRVLEGTPAYMSPEQTGRMNRGVDYRTDYYSLGVTLYELLTGTLPFPIAELIELVHHHLASPVVFPETRQCTIPHMVQTIILKLMAKNAEDRYQSALGLKHDLEYCQHSWDTTGTIPSFNLGRQDYSNRFLIPEKLYGRETDVQILLDTFERVAQGNSELMLVAGYSGVGKTAVIQEVHKPITQQKGYFIQGKFDQVTRNIPFSAFLQAFRSLVGQLLGESDAQVESWKSSIMAAVGSSGQVLIEVIPELEHIIGVQPPVPELSGSAAQNRFNRVFQQFIAVFTTPDHPLVIFLDDLQWVDSASLNLLQLLLGTPIANCLLVLGAYRDNEVTSGHLLVNFLDEIKHLGINNQTLILEPLTYNTINRLVADTLLCSTDAALPIAQLVYANTQGNPFFTVQFLQGLHDHYCITFDAEMECWRYDISCWQHVMMTDNVVDFMVERLQKLPEATQTVLQLAACVGNRFNLDILTVICDQHQKGVAINLWPALQSGLIVPESQTYKFFQGTVDDAQFVMDMTASYRFLHDRVQQSAYSLIPKSHKAQTHYKIGQLLLQKILPAEQTKRIFEIVAQLNQGLSILSTQAERDHLAQLNLQACQQAKSVTAYQAGYGYAQTGLSLLDDTSAWQRQYDMTLALHNALATLALLCGDFSVMETTVVTIIDQTESVLEQIPAYLVLIQGKIFQNQRSIAVEVGLHVLEKLGVSLPLVPTQVEIDRQLKQVSQQLEERAISTLGQLPTITNAHAMARIEVATSILGAAYVVIPSLFPILAALSIEQSIRYGNTGLSAFAYAGYGIVACALLKDIETGRQVSQLAQTIVTQFNAQTVKPNVNLIAGGFVVHRYSHIRDTLPLLKMGYLSALDTGNLEYAGINGHILCHHLFWSGQVLGDWVSESQNYYDSLICFHQPVTARYCKLPLEAALSLQNNVSSPIFLEDNTSQELDILTVFKTEPDPSGLSYFYIYKLWLYYLFGKFKLAQNCTVKIRENLSGVTGQIFEGIFWFLDSLTAMATLAPSDAHESLTHALTRVDINQRELTHHWASHAPMNYQHKVDLVNAEKYRILGQKAEAIDYYDRAITGAKETGFLQEEALANELAAKFYLAWDKKKIAAAYIQDAYTCYLEWGANAKTSDLVQQYPHLLQPILQPLEVAFNPLETLTSIVSPQISAYSSHTSNVISDNNNQAFDLAAILKAAQTLTETIQLDKLLQTLSQIILQNSGGDQLILVLPDHQDNWYLKVFATPDSINLCTEPIENNANVPVKLIQYVKNTREILYSDTLKTHFPIDDTYLIEQHPQSFLCAPLVHQNELFGVLYLHSSTTRGLISSEQIVILNFLFSQVAIGLKNANFFEESLMLKSKIIEFSIDGIAILENGKYIYMNKAHYLLFGYAIDELLGEKWERLYSLEELERLRETALPILQKTGQWSGEGIGLRKDGSTFIHEISVFHLDDGKLICICRDISERKHSEQQLQKLSERLELAINSAQIGIWEWDYQNERLSWDERMFAIYGIQPEDFTGTFEDWKKYTHPDDVAYAQQGAFPQSKAMNGDNRFTKEYRIIRPDGTVRYILATAMIQWDHQEQLVRAIGVNLDISDRKQLEQEQERLLQILQATSDFVGICQPPKGILWQNKPFRELRPDLKIFEEEVQISDLYPTWAYTLVRDEGIPTAIQEGTWSGETALLTQSGDEIPTSQVIIAHKSDNGEVEYFSTILRDISDRKAIERQLEFTQYGLDHAADCFYCLDEEANIVQVNQAACQRTGYTKTQLFNMTFHELTPTCSEENTWKSHWEKLKRLKSYSFESVQQTATGEIFPVEVVCNYLEFDGKAYDFELIRDITARKASEQALRDSQAQFRRMTENVPGMIYRYVLHPDGKHGLIYVSSQVREIYELAPEVVLQDVSYLQERIHPADRIHTDAISRDSAETLQPFKVEHRLILPAKGLRWIRAIAQPERLDNGDVVWDGVAIDISDRKQAEEKIRQTLVQLEASNNELEAFAYSISHDLRAPLRAINGFSQALLEDYGNLLDDNAQDYFKRIQANANRMDKLINDLLQLSRVSRSELRYTTVNLSTLAQEILNDLQASEPDRQVEFTIPCGITVLADTALMQVVLLNLLQNAWKFTSHHPTAHIEFGVLPPETQHTPNTVYFVKDDGAGFDMSYSHKLFGVFQRLHNAQEFSGTGIGLASVRRAVHRHGGQTWADAAIESGATFFFTIPIPPHG